MPHCLRCEQLMLAALDAAKAYRDSLADLELTRAGCDTERVILIQLQVAEALQKRHHAIAELNAHEPTHPRWASDMPHA